MTSGIYKIVNTVNGKFYIGSSVNMQKRFVQHRCLLRKNEHHNQPMQRAYNKYGADKFVYEIMRECDLSSLRDCEQAAIDKYFDTGVLYSTFRDAYALKKENHFMYGKTHTDEAKAKIKAARSKQIIKHSPETRAKIGRPGKPISSEQLKKMIAARGEKVWNKGLKTGIEPINKIKFTAKQIEKIISLYIKGESIESIRKIMNVDWDVIKCSLLSNGIKTRNISQQRKIYLNDRSNKKRA